MNNFTDDISGSEKDTIRSAVFAYADIHPLPVPSWWGIAYVQRHYLSVALIVLVLTGLTGVASAEYAVPGDIMYAIKTNITEPIITQVAFGDENKAQIHTFIAGRRLEEIEKLSQEGLVESATVTEVVQDFKHSTDSAQNHIEELHEDGKTLAALEIGSSLETLLNAHQEVITDSSEKNDVLAALVTEIQIQNDETNTTNDSVERDIITNSKPGELAIAAESRIAAVQELIEEVGNEDSQVEASLAKAEHYYAAQDFAAALQVANDVFEELSSRSLTATLIKDLEITDSE